MTPFDYDRWVKRWWTNALRRYRRFQGRMAERQESRLSFVNADSVKNWLIGKTVEDTFLPPHYGRNTPVRIQRMALRSLPSSRELREQGINPELLRDKLVAYVSERIGYEVELVEAIHYAQEGDYTKPTFRFVPKRRSPS